MARFVTSGKPATGRAVAESAVEAQDGGRPT
jgi:hypothetical protein